MERNQEDIKLAELLKKELPKAEENEYFTPNVLHRLPEKKAAIAWDDCLVYITGIVICVLYWINLVQGADIMNLQPVTVVKFLAAVTGTFVLIYKLIAEIVFDR